MKLEKTFGNRKITLIKKSTAVSTNDDAKKIRKDGALVLADTQTAGRGRLGRSFVSKKGGIYASLYLDLNDFSASPLFITSAAAVAAARAVDLLSGKKSLIKWVNDIYLDGKKVCGILAEGEIEAGKIKSAVLGIGVNLIKQYEFEKELSEKAGFIFENGDFEALRERFLDIFLEEFFRLFDNKAKKEISDCYKQKDFLKERKVSFILNGEKHEGTVLGTDEDINLLVLENGKEFKLSFGEVNIEI